MEGKRPVPLPRTLARKWRRLSESEQQAIYYAVRDRDPILKDVEYKDALKMFGAVEMIHLLAFFNDLL